MESGEIPDTSLTASSYFTYNHAGGPTLREPKYARLNHPTNAWCADVGDDNPWIQVDLGEEKVVVGIQVQGGLTYWIEELKIATALADAQFEYILDESNNPKVIA